MARGPSHGGFPASRRCRADYRTCFIANSGTKSYGNSETKPDADSGTKSYGNSGTEPDADT
jgi:hypothetical protein